MLMGSALSTAAVDSCKPLAWHEEHHISTSADDVYDEVKSNGPQQMRAIFTSKDNMWKNGVSLTYSFVYPYGTILQQKKVHKSMRHWIKYANVNFVYVKEGGKIRVSFDINSNEGSWSFIGRNIESVQPDKPTMNLDCIKNSKDFIGTEQGILLHEIGHTLGLCHEHQSPRRNDQLKLNKCAIISYFTQTRRWTEDNVWKQILNIEKNVSNYSEMDMSSIMMYPLTLRTDDGNVCVPQNTDFSDKDKAFIALNYPYFGRSAKRRRYINHALDIAGIRGVCREDIRNSYNSGDWQEMRNHLSQHSSLK